MGGVRTTTKYQNRGINTYVISAILKYFREKGLSRAIVATRKDNIAYQKSHAKLGSRICGEGYHLKVMFLWECWRLKS